MEKIALIGLGPHAKRIYYPYLEELVAHDKQFSFELIIDLEMNRERVEKFLKGQKLQPASVIYLKTAKQIAPATIAPEAAAALRQHGITKAIVSTEPKAHKIYLKECIKQGIPVVVDKPVTSPLGLTPQRTVGMIRRSDKVAAQIYRDVMELQVLLNKHPSSRVLVQCQRRNHAGYNLVLSTVADIVTRYGIPVTYVNIHHSDGMWNMPDEFIYRENHPYKYGYGKLMHSGYHFIDLLQSIIKINTRLEEKMPDHVTVFSQAVRPRDQHVTVGTEQYEQFFGPQKAKGLQLAMQDKQVNSFGEVDSFSQFQFTRQDRIITTAQLSLMQSGFSQRAWAELPEDTYKSNGRVRHEFVNIHIGPLCSIQVHSYQSMEIAAQKDQLSGPGDKNHFDIYIFRNSNLIGGKAFECISFGGEDSKKHGRDDRYLGHNEEARYQTLDELMYGKPSTSELSQHIETNKLLAAVYKNHIKQYYGKIPYSKFKFKDIFS